LTNFLKGDLFMVETLFEAAHRAGKTAATIGKTGAAFIQDYKRGGMMLDERAVLPLSLAQELQGAEIPLPVTSSNAYEAGKLTLAQNNGSPTAFGAPKRLKDGVTFDASDTSGSP
jgi:hypothetical protein